jgi:acyl carrier protein
LVPDLKTQLVGSADLDSAEIVNLVVAIEQQVEQDLGVSITLFDAVEQFVSVEALVNFITSKAGEGK